MGMEFDQRVGAREAALTQRLAYRQVFEKLIDVVRQLHDRGVFIVFGTDTGGSFTYLRELELYQKAGETAPEILKRATWDSARYVARSRARVRSKHYPNDQETC
jgi:imidazolonepropionase-like amidohydrolase